MAALAESPRSDRVPFLDGLRGLAVLLVVVMHYVCQPGTSDLAPGWILAARRLAGASWIGVDLFFVLSGFLLGGILMDHRSAPNLFRIFYWRRACRILPPYLLFLAPLALFPLFGIGQRYPAWNEHISTGDVPAWAFPLFLQNILFAVRGIWGEAWIAPTWSLAVEEQFYLFVPFVIRVVAPARLPFLLAGLVLAAPLLRSALPFLVPEPQARVAAYYLLPCRWDALLLGVLAAWALREPDVSDWLRQQGGRVRAATGVLLLAALGLALSFPDLYALPMRTAGYTVFALLFAAVVLGGCLDVLPGRRVLEWAWLRAVGRVSYTLYLIHVPISCLFFHLVARRARSMAGAFDLGLMGLSFVTALGVALLSWRILERPILAFGRSFPYRSPAPSS